jgi:hypothetical protein
MVSRRPRGSQKSSAFFLLPENLQDCAAIAEM